VPKTLPSHTGLWEPLVLEKSRRVGRFRRDFWGIYSLERAVQPPSEPPGGATASSVVLLCVRAPV
jgi:hypothetical protein